MPGTLPETLPETLPKAVVVHAGRRDSYQLALALDEGHLLDALVTDAYWDERWHHRLTAILPIGRVPERFCSGLDHRRVILCGKSLGATGAMALMPRWDLHEFSDAALGRKARAVAARDHAAMFSYSYYASHAFRPGPGLPRYRFLFQLHPHHEAVRQLLSEELERTPHGRTSLEGEVEMRLHGKRFDALAGEPQLSNGWVAASSYTARTLSERGVPAENIHVVPYGVDLTRFAQRARGPDLARPFTVIYVGSLVQRKGISYLLEAVRQWKTKNVRLLLRGRGNVDRGLLAHYGDVDFDLKIGLSTQELVHDLHRSDVFVLPSLTEGFAHVILEAMACGLPVITTANTCAPDVMAEGAHGFLVPLRDPDALREKLEWGMANREALAQMGRRAARQARLFTWERFRAGVRTAYSRMVGSVHATD